MNTCNNAYSLYSLIVKQNVEQIEVINKEWAKVILVPEAEPSNVSSFRSHITDHHNNKIFVLYICRNNYGSISEAFNLWRRN